VSKLGAGNVELEEDSGSWGIDRRVAGSDIGGGN
jgi:hypothetical protein